MVGECDGLLSVRTIQSSNPLPSKIRSMHFSTLASHVSLYLADEK